MITTIKNLWKGHSTELVLGFFLTAVLVFGLVFILGVVNGQHTKSETLSAGEFDEAAARYGFTAPDADDPYQYLEALYRQSEKQNDANGLSGILASGFGFPVYVEAFTSDGTVYGLDYLILGEEDLYTSRVELSYYPDGSLDIHIRQGDRITTLTSDLQKRVQYVK